MHAIRIARSFAVLLALSLALPALAGPKEDIMAAHQKLVERGKFRMTSVTEGGGDTTRTEAMVEWPDRYHMKIDAAGQKNEMIIIPGGTWMKQGGQWMKFPMDMGAMIQSMTPEAMKKAYDGMSNIREIGSAEVEGRDATGYAYDSKVTMMGVTSTSSVKLWIDDDTGLPLKQEIDGEAMGTKSTTVQVYDYESPVSVRAPQ
jgi:hypothetical protein